MGLTSKNLKIQNQSILRTQLRNPQFFQNCDHFQYNMSWNQNKVNWCIIENDHNFERTEDPATVFLKWTDINDGYKRASPWSWDAQLSNLISSSSYQTIQTEKKMLWEWQHFYSALLNNGILLHKQATNLKHFEPK